ncbi:HAD-IB family phosphatase [Pseudofrancisella aestuarii]|uniref:phosphoserine phosphatase n=1 Tax=Pseudofrancisella aestuarii TaxID=2670347 RepID=A0ABV9TBZ9_9GAMM|nr:HAD-IB family phosphatase [Pseudofrancisella aestuarii]
MKNIIFDFDSTLIKGESLEILLEPILAQEPQKLIEIEKITNMGMSGDIDFKTSLEKRLAIAKPTKKAIDDFVKSYCPNIFSKGMVELINKMHKYKYNVWIFSGGLADSIRPFAEHLNIPKENIYAVEVEWGSKGEFIKLNSSNGAAESKTTAMDKIKDKFKKIESIVVGDGYTDYQLYEKGYVDKFVAYAEHAQRENVLAKAKYIAKDSKELEALLF